jgi:meiotically up-regulated gene 157 (Mug157) protein
MAVQIRKAIDDYAVVYDARYGWIYAYEVDGLGNHELIDDANLPNLLSATYFGYARSDDPVYQNTRRFVLSRANPYYYSGRYASGLGSSHTPTGWVWPLALITRALTTQSSAEAAAQVRELLDSDDPEGRIHESFDPDDPSRFTRAEFGWANALFAELMFRSAAGLPGGSASTGPSDTLLAGDPQTSPISSPVQAWRNAGAISLALRGALGL